MGRAGLSISNCFTALPGRYREYGQPKFRRTTVAFLTGASGIRSRPAPWKRISQAFRGLSNAPVPSPALTDLQPMFEAQMSTTMPASVLTEEERMFPQLFVSGTMLASGFDTLCLEGVSVLFRMPLTVYDERGIAVTA